MDEGDGGVDVGEAPVEDEAEVAVEAVVESFLTFPLHELRIPEFRHPQGYVEYQLDLKCSELLFL